MKKKNCFRMTLHVIGGIVIMALFVAAIMGLWNLLIPAITGWSCINYWQALGLAVLFRLLTGHFGGHFRGRFGHRGRHRHLHERMHGMSREERKAFIMKRLNKFSDEKARYEE